MSGGGYAARLKARGLRLSKGREPKIKAHRPGPSMSTLGQNIVSSAEALTRAGNKAKKGIASLGIVKRSLRASRWSNHSSKLFHMRVNLEVVNYLLKAGTPLKDLKIVKGIAKGNTTAVTSPAISRKSLEELYTTIGETVWKEVDSCFKHVPEENYRFGHWAVSSTNLDRIKELAKKIFRKN